MAINKQTQNINASFWGEFTILNRQALILIFCFFISSFKLFSQDATTKDWPMFKQNALRTGATTETLSDQLKPLWSRQFPPLKTSSPDDPRIQYDKCYHPIVAGKILYVASSLNDCLYAISTTNGEILWRFYADAPIRFAPAVAKDKLFLVSDDSYLYCLQTSTGKFLWKYRGAPNNSKILVNGRLASPWPARGAPAVYDNKVYFSAGIWPFMGVFIYAIDTETGKPIWINSGSGSNYRMQAFDTEANLSPEAFAGPAPQGYITATKDLILIPNGRSAPAAYDAKTGELIYYHLPLKVGGYYAQANESFFFFSGNAFQLKTGKVIGNITTPTLLTPDILYSGSLQAFDLKNIPPVDPKNPVDKGKPIFNSIWNETLKIDMQALTSNRLYGFQDKILVAYDLPEINKELKAPKIAWQTEISGTPAEMIVADKKLFVVTMEGELICFCDSKLVPPKPTDLFEVKTSFDEISSTREDLILLTTNMYKGYCIVLGVGTGGLAEQLTKKTELSIIVVENDINQVNKFRRKWDDAQVYGSRIVILQGNPFDYPFPPYLANLIVSENIDFNKEKVTSVVPKIFHALRPYGGTACIQVPIELKDRWTHAIYENNLQMAGNRNKNGWTLLTREAQLFGAGDWSHQYADSANTVISDDTRVKAPLGLLWFGGPVNKNVLPRHGHGPSPQVAGGRVVTQGPSQFQAYDVYTGRMFWELTITDLGKAFDSNDHQPGANSIGSNYVTLADYIYIVFRGKCIKLEAETGAVVEVFELPPLDGQKEYAKWGSISVSGDYIIAGAEPINADNNLLPGRFTWNGTTSKAIVVLNRHTGKMVWKKEAKYGFRHNAIAAGNDIVFCIDLVPDEIKPSLPNIPKDGGGKIYAINLQTGDIIWSTEQGVFGTWLSYSIEHDILVQAGRPSRDMITNESNGRINTFQGKDGKPLWDKGVNYSGPCMIVDKEILTQNGGLSLIDGSGKGRVDTITNENVGWSFARGYGCATAIGSKNLLTFRSGAAGYYDLTNNGGTGNFGGIRAGCTSNLIVADGVLSIPDYSRGCTCSYQNQMTLALVHQPDVETWTFTSNKWSRQPIQRLGINLGAPGDRLSETKTMWIDYPSVGGPSQDIPIKSKPDNIEWFRQHSSFILESELPWVGASGAKGMSSLTIPTGNAANNEILYTIRFIFCEPDDVKPNERLIDVYIQGKIMLENIDVIKEAKGKNKVIIKEIKNVKSVGELLIELKPSEKATKKETILSGVEIISER